MKVMIFIDGKNFYSGWKNAGGHKIDFNLMADWLMKKVGGTRVAGVHYYTGVEDEENELPETQGNLDRFLSFLQSQRGFQVHKFRRKQYRLECARCQNEIKFTKEKEVDTSMVADMVRMAALSAYDIAILLSGDADYIPAIESVSTLGKESWIASWNGSGLSDRARAAAIDHINLVDGIPIFERKNDSQSTAEIIASTMPLPADRSPVHTHFVRQATHEPHTFSNGIRSMIPSSLSFGDDDEEIFVQELAKAQSHFAKSREGGPMGYVGLGYFLTKWRTPALNPSAEVRRMLLDSLVAKNRVKVYETPSGYQEIRVNPDNDEYDDDENAPSDKRPEYDDDDEAYGRSMDGIEE